MRTHTRTGIAAWRVSDGTHTLPPARTTHASVVALSGIVQRARGNSQACDALSEALEKGWKPNLLLRV